MAISMVGRKLGMTRIFQEDGASIPVTILEVTPNRVTALNNALLKTMQVTSGKCKPKKLTKPLTGHYKKAAVEPGRGLWEIKTDGLKNVADLKVGDELSVDIFQVGQKVDVRSKSKGKGFAGTIKKYNFAGQDATHGNSRSHRVPGSVGQNQSPGRVFKGKKMPGQMGNVMRTIQSQKIMRIDLEKSLMFVMGAVPGAPGGDVIITSAVKAKRDGE